MSTIVHEKEIFLNNVLTLFYLLVVRQSYLLISFFSGVTRSIERIREIPEYSGNTSFPVISWKNRLNKNKNVLPYSLFNLTCRPITMRRLGYHAIAYTFVRQYSFHICAIVLLASMLRSSRDWQLTNAK